MEHYAGLDVSLELTSVCVVDAQGQVVREVKVASEPEALILFLCGEDFEIARVGHGEAAMSAVAALSDDAGKMGSPLPLTV